MILLRKATIHKYKSIDEDQHLEINDDITVLVGKNESGKTSVLEALAKSNYFNDDKAFSYSLTHDYPRKGKKKASQSEQSPLAISCRFELSYDLLQQIEADIGSDVLVHGYFYRSTRYDNHSVIIGLESRYENFIKHKIFELGITADELIEKVLEAKALLDIENIIEQFAHEYEEDTQKLSELTKYFMNEFNWKKDPLNEYIYRIYLHPHIPKFLYYDEYFLLPPKISLEQLHNDWLNENEKKTANALFELAGIQINDLLDAKDFEDYKAELEATSITLTEEFFEYWSNSKDLEFLFDIEVHKDYDKEGQIVLEHFLNIRIRNNQTKVSLPLDRRSKGFNYFFSFLVWFKTIHQKCSKQFILLLDEPGLNLHAAAQKDLLKFFSILAKDHQVIYSTHSSNMLDPSQLTSVRTIAHKEGHSQISDAMHETDNETLLPIHGSMTQFLSVALKQKTSSDIFVEHMHEALILHTVQEMLRDEGLLQGKALQFTPIGTLENIILFAMLTRHSKARFFALLQAKLLRRHKSRFEDAITQKLLNERHIFTYESVMETITNATIEDLFDIDEYLLLFNKATYNSLDALSLESNSKLPLTEKIKLALNSDTLELMAVAMELAKGTTILSTKTKERFTLLFSHFNKE